MADPIAETETPRAPAQGEKIDLEIPTFLRRQNPGASH